MTRNIPSDGQQNRADPESCGKHRHLPGAPSTGRTTGRNRLGGLRYGAEPAGLQDMPTLLHPQGRYPYDRP